MEVEIKLDSTYTETKVIILTADMNEEVRIIAKKLSENIPDIITGIKNGKVEMLEENDLIQVYANGGKVFAVTNKGEYALRKRLYEMEERLNQKQFVRISNSEVINLKKVENFDLNFAGTICVRLSNGTVTYVSRRYVKKIKKLLGL